MSYNRISIIGHLGGAVELKYIPSGMAVATFNIATSEKKKNKSGTYESIPIWFKVTVWGKMGENAAKYLAKGSKAYVEGKLGVSDWTNKDGANRYTLEVNANEVQYLDSAAKLARADNDHTGQPDAARNQDEMNTGQW